MKSNRNYALINDKRFEHLYDSHKIPTLQSRDLLHFYGHFYLTQSELVWEVLKARLKQFNFFF